MSKCYGDLVLSNEFLSICTTPKWEELEIYMDSSVGDVAFKIFVSALIQAGHPDEACRNKFSLANYWDKKLSNIPIEPLVNFLTGGRVWLRDFHKACYIANVALKESNIDPKEVQKIICDYVNSNKIKLFDVVKTHKEVFPDGVIEDLNEMFGNLEINKTEKKKFELQQKIAASSVARQQMKAEERRQMIALQITELFALEPGICNLHPEQDSSYTKKHDKLFNLPNGSYTMWQAKHLNDFDQSRIVFGEQTNVDFEDKTNGMVEKCADKLKKIGLNVHYCYYPSYAGLNVFIQLRSPLKEVIEKLDEALAAKIVNMPKTLI